jgi:hypothetical protein
MAPRPEYYVAQPPALPMYPTPPVYAKQETSSPIPWWVWMAAGILVANVARMVSFSTSSVLCLAGHHLQLWTPCLTKNSRTALQKCT